MLCLHPCTSAVERCRPVEWRELKCFGWNGRVQETPLGSVDQPSSAGRRATSSQKTKLFGTLPDLMWDTERGK